MTNFAYEETDHLNYRLQATMDLLELNGLTLIHDSPKKENLLNLNYCLQCQKQKDPHSLYAIAGFLRDNDGLNLRYGQLSVACTDCLVETANLDNIVSLWTTSTEGFPGITDAEGILFFQVSKRKKKKLKEERILNRLVCLSEPDETDLNLQENPLLMARRYRLQLREAAIEQERAKERLYILFSLMGVIGLFILTCILY